MGTDEYWTGITRYVPAQEKNFDNMLGPDDVKSASQLMPFVALSHLSYKLGLEEPYSQYRFVQMSFGLLSTFLLVLFSFLFFKAEIATYSILAFAVYFGGPFIFTRPMFEAVSAPWVLLSALAIQKYQERFELRRSLISVFGISLAFLLRPQVGICALGLLYVIAENKRWRDLVYALLLGLVFFIIAGIPDLFWGSGFHSSLKNILFYNVKHGATYGQQPWFFYLPLVFVMMGGPFLISKKSFQIFKDFWPQHKVYWIYIGLLIFLHSLFPQKWERFIIPVLPLMILITRDWISYFWRSKARLRVIAALIINGLLWIPANLSPAQNNIIEMSVYLNKHPEIHEILRFENKPEWITEVFISRKDWKWTDVKPWPDLEPSCSQRLIVQEGDYPNLPSALSQNLVIETKFETNMIEKVAYKLNPTKNLRRTPLLLLKSKNCNPAK